MIDITVTGNANRELNTIYNSANRADNQIKNLITTFASFSIAKSTITSVISTFSDMQVGLLEIQKTTGLTGVELNNLTDSLNELSTSTRGMEIESLYKISAIAGQLGIKGKENILSFTEAIKKMEVTSDMSAEQAGESFAQLSNALGEPIKNITRITSTFTSLASSTTASEGVLVNYVQRLSGAGKTLELSTAQIAGLGATLKDVGLTAELSTTAMSSVFMKFLTDTQKITDALDLDFNKFSTMVKEEPNKALLIFLDSLGKLDKVSKVQALKDMEMGGAGLSSTLLKLSDNTGLLTKNINTASEAYAHADSAEKEFDIASQSLKAKQEQLTSSLKIMSHTLGKELEPSLVSVIDSLLPLTQYIKENSKEIIQLTKFVGVLFITWKSLNRIMSMSPFGRIVAGLTAIIGVAYKATDAIRSLINAQKDTDNRTKTYLKKINSETYKNKLKIEQLKKLKIEQNLYNKSIENTTKLLNNKNLSSNQKETLEKNLALQGQKLNKIILQSRELSYLVKITKDINKNTPKSKDVKINIPKIDIKEINKLGNSIHNVGVHSNKTSKKIKNNQKSLNNEIKRLNEQFNNDYNKATNDKYNYERLKLKEKYDNYKKTVSDKNKINIWYQSELKKINDKELEESIKNNKKIEDERKNSLEKQLKIDNQFNNIFKQSTLKKYDYKRYKLKQEYDNYKKTVSDKNKINIWYQSELKKINNKEVDDYRKKLIKEIDEEIKKNQKIIEENNKKNKILSDNFNKYISSLSNTLINVGIKIDKDKLDNLGKNISDILAKGVNQGFENADYTKLGSSLTAILSDYISKELTPTNSKQQEVGSQVGGGLGGAIGTAYGGPVGGAIGSSIGSIVGGWAGGGLFGGKKTDYIYINSDGSATYVTRTSGGQWGKDKYKTNDIKSLQLEQDINKEFDNINNLFDNLGQNINISLNSLYDSLGGTANIYKVKTKNFDKDLSKTILSLINESNSNELYDIWSTYADSINQTTLQALGESLQVINIAEDKIFEYLNRDDNIVILENRLKKLDESEKALEETLGLGDVTLENYNNMVSKLIEIGDVTPETTQALANLSNVLIAQSDITNQLAEEADKKNKELTNTLEDTKKNEDIEEPTYKEADGKVYYDYVIHSSPISSSYTSLIDTTDKLAKIEENLKNTRAKELTSILETNKQLDLSSKVYLINYKNSIKDKINELEQLELNKIDTITTAFNKSFDSLDTEINKLNDISSLENNSTIDMQSSLIEYNKILDKIKTKDNISEEEFNNLNSKLTSSLSGLNNYSKDSLIATQNLINYSKNAKKELDKINIIQTIDNNVTPTIDNTEEIKLQSRLLKQINKSLGDDKSVVEVDNNKLVDILESNDLNYLQTQQLINAFSDNILTSDELLNVKDLNDIQLNNITSITNIDVDKTIAINEQIDYLKSIGDEATITNKKLDNLNYLFTINTEEVRKQRMVLEDILNGVEE